jgi:NitT/TauT family transport system ATP-binding protein
VSLLAIRQRRCHDRAAMETSTEITGEGAAQDGARSLPRAIATLRGVGKTFPNGVVAVKDLDLDIKAGEFVTLLGPSGCGKSTALRMLAGLVPPSQGTIAWREQGASGDLSFVFQEPTLMPWATVAGNVRLPLMLLGRAPQASAPRLQQTLDRVGLGAFAGAYPRELSGGMKMRVSIARALVTDPKLLLMDEPFAALDEITRFKLNDDLLALWSELRKTVVFVTHSVFESVYLSQRIVVMTPRPGRIFQEIVIDAPYPRDESFRTSAEYAALCRTVSQALAAATAEDGRR